MASSLRSRPCRICRRWFRPDPRLGQRQRACSRAECQAARRQKTQAAWRAAHPDYEAARRLQQKAAQGRREAPRVVAPLERLPWDMAQDALGAEGAEFLGEFGRVLVRHAQDARRAQVLDST